MRIRRPRRRRW